MPVVGAFAIVLGAVLGIALLVAVIVLLSRGIGSIFRVIGLAFVHVFRFIGGELTDALRLVGAVVLLPFVVLLTIGSILIGRWSATTHYGRALQDELRAAGLCIYRMAIGHPARLLFLTPITDKLEKRLPEVVKAAPTRDTPKGGRTGSYPGYRIVGSLKGGGSGGKLYVAEPEPMKRAALERSGREVVDQVVIKSFSLKEGSGLDQIIRESTALENGKKLGLVLEHHRDADRFYYVMPYVPGEPFGQLISRLHSESPAGGLDGPRMRRGFELVGALLETLDGYHRGGVWHKDVKPDNIIVNESGAHLVDFGLVTPLRSAMTLTTHGTEYFRDPELVRMALKGVKVHQVDGARFDTYAAGAVLYALIENSFPAHGGLSQISKNCPPAAKWIVRRAMADYEKRYPTAAIMLADLNALLASDDPFSVKPAQLPSMNGAEAAPELPEAPIDPLELQMPAAVVQQRRTPEPSARPDTPAQPEVPAARRAPAIRVSNWWTGASDVAPMGPDVVRVGRPASPNARTARQGDMPRLVEPAGRRTAREQRESAQQRARAAQARAHDRMRGHRRKNRNRYNSSGVNAGVAVAVFLFLAACVGVAALMVNVRGGSYNTMVAPLADATSGGGFTVTRDGVTISAGGDGLHVATAGNSVAIASAPSTPDVPGMPDVPGVGAAVASVGTVLVVSDLRAPIADELLGVLGEARVRLANQGIHVTGDVLMDGAMMGDSSALSDAAMSPGAIGEAVELVALARRARGQGVLGSDEVIEALESLDRNRADIDGIVWLAPATSGRDDRVGYLVVSAEGVDSYDADGRHIAEHLPAAIRKSLR